MTTNILATALALSDDDLLTRIDALACTERETTADLVAHLAALELRPSLHAAEGYGSLFAYCTEHLHLSEDAACNRIQAARVCRSFPAILDLLASGAVTLSAIRMLGPHLTTDNHQQVLARAMHRRREDILALVAELAPRADVAASVRKLPVPKLPVSKSTEEGDSDRTGPTPTLPLLEPALSMPETMDDAAKTASPATASGESDESELSVSGTLPVAPSAPSVPPRSGPSAHRPIVQALAPRRYRVQFTIGQEAYNQLRRMQALLRREIPTGDAGLIFEQALALLAERVETAKLGAAARSRSKRVIRPGADKGGPSRHIPNEVKRAVWWRDRAQCAFVSSAGHRCTEHNYLELHHIQPYAMDGPATVGNISLRCRRHNQYEAELVFGQYSANRVQRSP
jgi:hypothetical protein